jgi:transaldolase
MKLFIDTANLEEIAEATALGIICGVTTNPSLVALEGQASTQEFLLAICKMVDGPISYEVLSPEAPEMVEEARKLASIDRDKIVIKVPLCSEGLKATKLLKVLGIKTNLTLVFSAQQALLAARAGATYVSPFVGRLDDIGADGIALVRDIVAIFEYHGIETEIIAASIRHPIHVLEAAKAGAHIATVPFRILKQMINHPLTEAGIKKFNEDWSKIVK